MLNFISKYTFSRSGGTLSRNQKKTEILLNRHLQKRAQSLKNQTENYHYLQNDVYNPEIQRVQLYGQEQIVIGSQQDARSPNFVLAMIGQFDPKSVVLGGLNKLQLKEYQVGKKIYESEPVIQNNEEDLPAKEILTHFFQEDLEFGNTWFYQEGDQCVYRAIKSTRQAIMEDHLSCGFHLYEKPNRHLIFGKPDLNLVFEDLALRLSLKQLQDVFYHVIQLVQEDLQQNHDQRYPYFENERIYDMFRMKVREIYSELLLNKSILYTASIFKKTARTFKKSAIIVPNEITKQVAVQTLEPMAPEWNQIFRAYVDNEKDQGFFAAEKFTSKKYSRSFRNIKRYFKEDPDYDHIMKAAEKQSAKYDYYSKERPLFELIKEQQIDADEILEKYVIINHLLEKSTLFYLESGVNPFNTTIFHGLFKEKYGKGKEAVNQIIQKYEKFNSKYALELHKIQNFQIKRIGEYELEWRPNLENFSQSVKRLEEKPQNYNYEFVTGQLNRDKRDRIVETVLLKTMVGLLKQREQSGISQSDQISHLKDYFEGKKTQENIKIFNQLIIEANHTLGCIVKFPQTHKQFLPYLVNLRKYQILKQIEQKLDAVEEQVNHEKKFRLQNITNVMSIEQIAAKRMEQQNQNKEIGFDQEEEKIESFKELFENFQEQMLVLGENPEKIPFDIKGKSLEQLEEMGFQAAGELEFQVDDQGNVEGIETEQTKEVLEFLETLRKTEKDDLDFEEIEDLKKEYISSDDDGDSD
ncbi:hypothetical protein ABPG74_017832 [Tetrahymena malaccensis]